MTPPNEVEIESELVDYVIDTAIRVLGNQPRPLAHPLATDAKFAENLDTISRIAARAERLQSLSARYRTSLAARIAAGKANPWADLFAEQQQALVHVLHQLDHRTKFPRLAVPTHRVHATGAPGRRLALLKPDMGGTGGFEAVLKPLASDLSDRGWTPQFVSFEGHSLRDECFGMPVGLGHIERHPELWHYLFSLEALAKLDLSEFDVVLTTQPPSYLVNHPRVAAIFYHQPRAFFDLADEFGQSRFAEPSSHAHGVRSVRRVEQLLAPRVKHWFAGSREAADRLQRFFGVETDRISTIYPSPETSDVPAPQAYDPSGPVVTVGRHEWPKRVALAVAAAHTWDAENALVVIGDGSRLEHSRSLDADLGAREADLAALDDRALWINPGVAEPGWTPSSHPASGRVRFVTDATDAERDALYRSASVVICPAYQEDHGLTPLEAMAAGRPVVVCTDGGGLTEFVDDGVNGLVAAPTPAGLAGAVDQILSNPAAAESMGMQGHALISTLRTENAADKIAAVLDQLMAEDGEAD